MFEKWWKCENTERPLMNIKAVLDKPAALPAVAKAPESPKEAHIGLEGKLPGFLNYANHYAFLCEAVPNFSINIGPGSLATYVGSEPIFAWDTIWYTKCIDDISTYPALKYDPDNYWWKLHFEVLKEARRLSEEQFYVCIPDIIENMDIISAMNGPEETCLDMMDNPGHVKRLVESVDNIYFEYFDRFYEELKIGTTMMYTAFEILGEGKTAKVQCDFNALIGPEQFVEFVVPSLTRQCDELDHSVFHLDGKDCIKHLDALMAIDSLQALQWTPGAGQPDGGNEKWYQVYDKVKDAGKAMHVGIYDGGYDDWVNTAGKFIKRYGCAGVYFLFPAMTQTQAEKLIYKAENEWRNS
jgi:5-methyltetrahydrofolate--homocysteine methyltransferase